MKDFFKHFSSRKLLIILFDLAIAGLSCFLSYIFFKEVVNVTTSIDNIIIYSIITLFITLVVFFVFRLYNTIWRYSSIMELTKMFFAIALITLVNGIIALFTRDNGISYVPVRLTISTGLFQLIGTFISRFFYRINKVISLEVSHVLHKDEREKVMLIGAGSAGVTLIREMRNTSLYNYFPACFIDDDKDKIGSRVENVKVVGDRTKIIESVEKYKIQRIIVTIPSLDAKELSNIVNICKETKCIVQVMPNIYNLLNKTPTLSTVRDVDIKDLLGREQIIVNLEEINGYLKNQVVMVTGGGGSIGSELCRQIALSQPQRLIIVDIYENNAYDIEQELKRNHPDLDLVVLIASVRDKYRIETIFEQYHPNIVIHAAAHKHVPLMETSPNEAVKNNVFGTLNVAKASDKYGVKRFILISTDKAVNPTNVMGATKRICEMIVQTINKHSKTEFVAVRFGNVLGSNGSVIPLFKKQIANGGPVTVTDERIIRYFMTIPEAVSLVLQAGSYAKGGEIFVLDMGEPVKIYDLAYNLIRLSGFVPNEDIKIKIVGLRPGEKLYEEILMDEEGLSSTPNKLIHIGQPIKFDEQSFFNNLDKLYKVAYEETNEMKLLIKEIVTTYKPDIK